MDLIKDNIKSVYNNLAKLPQKLFPQIIICLLIAGTIFLHPTISAMVTSGLSGPQLSDLLNDAALSGNIDAKRFWEFRSKYSPGHFTINEEAIVHRQTYTIQVLSDPKTKLLTYHSPKIESHDYVIEQHIAAKAIAEHKNDQAKIILENDYLLIQQFDNNTQIIFVKPISDMRKANGFFNYTSNEQELLQNRLWLNETIISE